MSYLSRRKRRCGSRAPNTQLHDITSELFENIWDFFPGSFLISQIVSDRAVCARDFLAEAYMASKEKAGELAGATVHNTLQVRTEEYGILASLLILLL